MSGIALEGKSCKIDKTNEYILVPTGVADGDTHLYTPSEIHFKVMTSNLNGEVYWRAIGDDGIEITIDDGDDSTAFSKKILNTSFGDREYIDVWVDIIDEFIPDDDSTLAQRVFTDQVRIFRLKQSETTINTLITTNDIINTIDTDPDTAIIYDIEGIKNHIGVYEGDTDSREEWRYFLKNPTGIANVNVDNTSDIGLMFPNPISNNSAVSFSYTQSLATLDLVAQKSGQSDLSRTLIFQKNHPGLGRVGLSPAYNYGGIPTVRERNYPGGNLYPIQDIEILSNVRYFGMPATDSAVSAWYPDNIVFKAMIYNVSGPFDYQWTIQAINGVNEGSVINSGNTPYLFLNKQTWYDLHNASPLNDAEPMYSYKRCIEVVLTVTSADSLTFTDKMRVYNLAPNTPNAILYNDYMKVAADSDGNLIQDLFNTVTTPPDPLDPPIYDANGIRNQIIGTTGPTNRTGTGLSIVSQTNISGANILNTAAQANPETGVIVFSTNAAMTASTATILTRFTYDGTDIDRTITVVKVTQN